MQVRRVLRGVTTSTLSLAIARHAPEGRLLQSSDEPRPPAAQWVIAAAGPATAVALPSDFAKELSVRLLVSVNQNERVCL